MDIQFAIKNLPSEKPPPTDIPINPKNSYMTSLMNFCIANGKMIKIKADPDGLAHMPQWTSTCLIDNEEYGKACAFTKRSAENEAARQSIEMLEKEGLSFPAMRNYYPIFMDFLVDNHLTERVKFESTPHGPEHKRTWRCVVSLDGFDIGMGEGSTKKTAVEEASVSAAGTWRTFP